MVGMSSGCRLQISEPFTFCPSCKCILYDSSNCWQWTVLRRAISPQRLPYYRLQYLMHLAHRELKYAIFRYSLWGQINSFVGCSLLATIKINVSVHFRGVPTGLVPPKLPKFDLTTDAEYVANLVYVKKSIAVYYMGMLYLHNDIFLTDLIGMTS